MIPPYASRALAAACPDIVTYVPFSFARHTKLWNYDTNLARSQTGYTS
jgi:hypothetical protein